MIGFLFIDKEYERDRNTKDHKVKQVWKKIHTNFHNYSNEQDEKR